MTKPSKQGHKTEVKRVSLDDIGRAQPCRSCFPDAPPLRSAHRYCTQCNKTNIRPCEHNGGVLVPMTRTRRKASPWMDVGSTYIRYDYVWPEQLHLFVG